jgi:hypothetical protein
MPQASFFVELGTLVVVWLAGWGVAFWLIKRGITYVERYLVTSFVFLSFSALLIVLFRRRFETLTGTPTALPFLLLFLVVMITLGLYAVCPRYFSRPDALIARHPEEFYLRLDYRYLVSKSFEVLFQQLVIVVLTLLLAATGLSMMGIVLAFLVLFGLMHLPMLRIVGRGPGVYYTIAASTFAVVFPILILRVHYGFVYSYAAHWFAYMLAGALVWLHAGTAPRARVGSTG